MRLVVFNTNKALNARGAPVETSVLELQQNNKT